jgi:molecular chaperone GrpE
MPKKEKLKSSPPEEEVIDDSKKEETEVTEKEEQEEELITLKMEVYQALLDERDVAVGQAEENLDGWQRSQAEFQNFKKRIQREQEQFLQDAKGTIIKRYLDIMDDLARALKNRPADSLGADWADGIDLIYRKLVNYLESEGVTRMEAEGLMFDPQFHEAISQEESPDHESGQIIEVLNEGYLIGERVLRPAVVRVAK